ncbi:hypothetical protein [Cohaesibacter celericrescens]|uniref:Uncharacterized protein n=1 Tax=Cohaesibacter celericrescens TaxID=2067669 RepID=A0A2N5XXC0_9HYPH|nr:hypothetical protein [Cohaesibacter celericrescens]PLW79068.1 hypothetical protein C0081_02220 [Cohaesibacter celericrescens]
MTDIVVYPDKLPLPTYKNYSMSPLDRIQRTEMESGYARQRLKFTNAPELLSVRWVFSEWQFALFQSWYRDRAKSGAAWISITLQGSLGLTPHEVRFKGQGQTAFTANLSSTNRWEVTAMVEAREPPVLSSDVLDLLLTRDDFAAFEAMSISVDTFINDRWPNMAGW